MIKLNAQKKQCKENFYLCEEKKVKEKGTKSKKQFFITNNQ